MPVLARAGVAAAAACGFNQGGNWGYITGFFPTAAGTSSVLQTLGVRSGDFALFGSLATSSVSSASGTAWTNLGGDGAVTQYRSRILDQTDIGAGITYGADCCIVIWRGPRSAAIRGTTAYAGADPVTIAGYTKNAAHYGNTAFAYTIGAAPTITTPATWTQRGSEIVAGSRLTAYDRIPPETTYVNGTAFEATFGGVTGQYTVLELMQSA